LDRNAALTSSEALPKIVPNSNQAVAWAKPFANHQDIPSRRGSSSSTQRSSTKSFLVLELAQYIALVPALSEGSNTSMGGSNRVSNKVSNTANTGSQNQIQTLSEVQQSHLEIRHETHRHVSEQAPIRLRRSLPGSKTALTTS
jgi:hypothetical protein